MNYYMQIHFICGSANKMKIETMADLKAALKEVGYSSKAITEITKWYTTNRTPAN